MTDVEVADAPAWPVVQVRHVHAASAGEAVDITDEELHILNHMSNAEPGFTTGGVVIGVLNGEPIDFYMEGLTVNQTLQEAALILLTASFQEGDDGTGGVQTEEDVQLAIDAATEALQIMKEARG